MNINIIGLLLLNQLTPERREYAAEGIVGHAGNYFHFMAAGMQHLRQVIDARGRSTFFGRVGIAYNSYVFGHSYVFIAHHLPYGMVRVVKVCLIKDYIQGPKLYYQK